MTDIDERQLEECMEEMHTKLVDILAHLVDVLPTDDLTLLCIQCGVSTNELMSVDEVVLEPIDAFSTSEPF